MVVHQDDGSKHKSDRNQQMISAAFSKFVQQSAEDWNTEQIRKRCGVVNGVKKAYIPQKQQSEGKDCQYTGMLKNPAVIYFTDKQHDPKSNDQKNDLFF